MESPRKNNDCYFFYYSTCTKGDSCSFRHEPTALGCETVCSFWQQGKCLNQHCNFRHMELRKNRKVIPCYWENQPGGCLKPHCPFQHKAKKLGSPAEHSDTTATGTQPTTQDRPDWNRRTVSEMDAGECAKPALRRVSQGSETASYGSPAVDPLVVNFEEESDNESMPTSSPGKRCLTPRSVRVKTLEEIRLEKVQAESAAYYSYPTDQLQSDVLNQEGDDLRKRILNRLNQRTIPTKSSNDFQVLTLDEIRKRKQQSNSDEMNDEDVVCEAKVRKLSDTKAKKLDSINFKDVKDIQVKTLAEIRAARLANQQDDEQSKENNKRALSPDLESTSHKKFVMEKNVSSTEEPDMLVSSSSTIIPLRRSRKKHILSENGARLKPKLIRPKITETLQDSDVEMDHLAQTVSDSQSDSRIPDLVADCTKANADNNNLGKSEESFLLMSDSDSEELSSVSLTAADDILSNIDDILND